MAIVSCVCMLVCAKMEKMSFGFANNAMIHLCEHQNNRYIDGT